MTAVQLFALLLLASLTSSSLGARQRTATAGTPYTSCAEKKDPIAVRIDDCTASPCKLVKGTTASFQVEFEVDQDTEELEAVVTGYALGMTVDFPLKQKNACLSLSNAECPLDKYEDVIYKLQLDVDKNYPSISAAAQVTIKSKVKGSKPMVCFKVNLQIVDSEQ